MQKVIVIGDTHGDWGELNSINRHLEPDVAIVAGDFGFWPKFHVPTQHAPLPKPGMIRTILPSGKNVEIRFCDGNHENHHALLAIAPRGHFEPVEVAEGIFYQPRGSVFRLDDGRTIFFAGGGKSVDHKMRTVGKDYFLEEILLRSDLPEDLPPSDIVISHAAPSLFDVLSIVGHPSPPLWWDLSIDPTTHVLDEVLSAVQPELWICGHYHSAFTGTYTGDGFLTKYHLLSDAQRSFLKQCVLEIT